LTQRPSGSIVVDVVEMGQEEHVIVGVVKIAPSR
jgi:hypothetical protein